MLLLLEVHLSTEFNFSMIQYKYLELMSIFEDLD